MTPDLRIVRLPVTLATLDAYAAVSAAAVVQTRLSLAALRDPAGYRLVEQRLAAPLTLDNDVHERPPAWADRDDLDRWVMLSAFAGDQPAGGAIVAVEPEDHWFFLPEPGQAVLWDLRVAPAYRAQRVGSRLMREAAAAALEAGCHRLAIETQDVNVAACRLYASAGAVLGEVRSGAYREHPDEAALLWFMDLNPAAP